MSRAIASRIGKRYGVPLEAIPDGVAPAEPPATTEALDRFGLVPARYVILVARLIRHPLDQLGA